MADTVDTSMTMMSYPLTHIETRLAVPLDRGLLIATSMDEIEEFGAEHYKGGLYENAMPEAVADEILALPTDTMRGITNKIMLVDPETGLTNFTPEIRSALSVKALAFINRVSLKFNKVGDWPTRFILATNLEKREASRLFHIDTRSGDVVRQFRALVNVSDDVEMQDHETELMMTDGLAKSEISGVFRQQGHYRDLPEPYAGRVAPIRSRDMALLKGLGDGHSDTQTEAFYHRSPLPEDGGTPNERRYSLVWERDIEIELDLG